MKRYARSECRMKVILKEDSSLEEGTVVISASNAAQIQQIKQLLQQQTSPSTTLHLFGLLDGKEYRLRLEELLFFETNNDIVYAHTATRAFEMKERLYELEKILPRQFMRISKSTILHIPKLDGIERGISGPSRITFRDTEKDVYVSRKYYPLLKEQLK